MNAPGLDDGPPDTAVGSSVRIKGQITSLPLLFSWQQRVTSQRGMGCKWVRELLGFVIAVCDLSGREQSWEINNSFPVYSSE